MFVAHNLGGDKMNKKLKQALESLRKEKERKFDQTVELILNLQKFNTKKDSVNTVISMPYKIKEKKIAAFFEIKNKLVETITESEFKKYSDKKLLKNLVGKYDFFMAQASLMPKVATTFGKVLGPSGKMPSPQLGIIMDSDEKTVKELIDKINKSAKVRTKEASIKIPVGKFSMKDEEIIENILTAFNAIVKSLPREKENIKNMSVKFTMTKPARIGL